MKSAPAGTAGEGFCVTGINLSGFLLVESKLANFDACFVAQRALLAEHGSKASRFGERR